MPKFRHPFLEKYPRNFNQKELIPAKENRTIKKIMWICCCILSGHTEQVTDEGELLTDDGGE